MKLKRSKLIIRIILLIGTPISLYFIPWILVRIWLTPLPDTIEDQMLKTLDYGFEGMIVYVDQAGKAPQTYAAGWHERENETAARTDALFKIASIRKLYDAVAVTKLVSDGRLSLDKTLADYMPELVGFIDNADEITIRLMIQHRSGIPNYTDAPGFWEKLHSYEECLALIEGMLANFEPDKDYEYCNTNYLLIQKIMNNILGYDNFQFIKEEILDRLNLHNSYGSLNEVKINDIMSGYHQGYPLNLRTDDHGMLATVEDVGIFLRALNDGSLFDEGEKDMYASIYEFEHSGWVPGYQSFAKYHEDLDAVVIQFYSTTDKKLLLWNLSQIINKRIYRIIKKN